MSALDPYAELGVKRDATRKQIDHAYRTKAGKAHPDKPGGSPEAFHRVKLAYDILKDESRRAKFDATGDASEQTPAVNPDHGAIEWIGNAIAGALAAPDDPWLYDLCAAVIQYLSKHAEQTSTQIETVRRVNERAKKLRKRFKRRKGDGENVLDGIVAWHETQSAAMMAKFNRQLVDLKRAVAIVTEYGFEQDSPLQQLVYHSQSSQASAGAGRFFKWGGI